jgi:hypothetical protein
MGWSRQTSIAKVCHNMWYTGMKHTIYHNEPRPCCMCGDDKEDWRHVITCRSLDASLHRADSWEKVKKDMAIWQLPPDFWTTVQKGLQLYIDHPQQRVQDDPQKPIQQPVSPCPPGFNQPHNRLKQAYHAQYNIGWGNFTKGRITRHWQIYINYHLQSKNISLPGKEWAPKLIIALLEHLGRIWNLRNGVYHTDYRGKSS